MKIEITGYKNLNDDKLKEVNHGKKTILIGKIDGQYYAVSGKCTHLGCNLYKGQYHQGVITCPCHGSKFKLINGKVLEWIGEWPNIVSKLTKLFGLEKDLQTYEVFEEDDKLFIEVY
ncbi:MAG: Rieske (2Fe-2S) protein [Clostridia bacterium]